jgi:hypothetical protein
VNSPVSAHFKTAIAEKRRYYPAKIPYINQLITAVIVAFMTQQPAAKGFNYYHI